MEETNEMEEQVSSIQFISEQTVRSLEILQVAIAVAIPEGLSSIGNATQEVL